MPTVEITVENEAELVRFFEKFEKAIQDATHIWPLVVKEFYKIEEEQFASEGHGRWAPLSLSYARWKQATHPGQPLLVLEGRLKAAATGGAGSVVEASPRQVKVGIKGIPYFQYHQQGTSTMPQRKVVDLSSADLKRIVKVLANGIRDAIRKAT